MRKALLLLSVLVLTGSAQAGPAALPPPVFTVPGTLAQLAAAGPSVALMVIDPKAGCMIRVGPPEHPVPFAAGLPCRSSAAGEDSLPIGLWLGRSAIAAELVYSESPHSEDYTYWLGPRPRGPMRQQGEEWVWNDSDVPPGSGCAHATVAGGGVIASARVPNRLAVEHNLAKKPACLSGPSTTVELSGAGIAHLTVSGSWKPLATDGKRIALARLDTEGHRTGEVALYSGKSRIPFDQPDPPWIRTTERAWLTPAGLIVQPADHRLVGPGWMTLPAQAVAVGEGRVVYLEGTTLRVRRLKGTADRVLLRLPNEDTEIAAGSFGVAIAIDYGGGKVLLYRLPWKTIDRTLTA